MGVPLYQAKAEFFKTLGHPARIRILELLSERDHAVHELLDRIAIEPSNLSQQLAVLRRTSMVVSHREGRRGHLLGQRARGPRPAAGRPPHPVRPDQRSRAKLEPQARRPTRAMIAPQPVPGEPAGCRVARTAALLPRRADWTQARPRPRPDGGGDGGPGGAAAGARVRGQLRAGCARRGW